WSCDASPTCPTWGLPGRCGGGAVAAAVAWRLAARAAGQSPRAAAQPTRTSGGRAPRRTPGVAGARPDAIALVAQYLFIPRARRMPRAAPLRHRLSSRAGRHSLGQTGRYRRTRLGGAGPWRSRAGRRLDGGAAVTAAITLDLVADGALRLTLERSLYRLAERWIPQGLGEPGDAPARGLISVRASPSPVPLRRPTERPTLVLGGVAVWVDQDRAIALLRGAAPASGGVLSLVAGRARLQVDATGAPAAADLYSMLTVSAALLLAGLGRALVHAAAVVAPDGDAWLLAGDARAGKSTTCATLASAGWGYVSDDLVVLTGPDDGVEVEGWLRPFHL